MTSGQQNYIPSETDSTASTQVQYHESSASYRTEFDQETRLVTEAVIDAVVAATQTDPLELPPLYSVIDPDALNGLFTTGSEREQSDSTVTFEYATQIITVNSRGTVNVEQAEKTSS